MRRNKGKSAIWSTATGKTMKQLRCSDVSAYIEKRKADGVGPATINRELDLPSAAINYARKRWEWDIQNPVSGMSLRLPEGRLRWLSRAEADVLIREAEKDRKSLHLADFIRLALNTGCRKNEMLKLSWDRVDLKANVLRTWRRETSRLRWAFWTGYDRVTRPVQNR